MSAVAETASSSWDDVRGLSGIKIDTRNAPFSELKRDSEQMFWDKMDNHRGTEDALRHHVTKDIDTIIRNDCFINDNGITSVRVASDPMVFSIKTLKEFEGGKQLISTLAAADGIGFFSNHYQ